MATNNNRPPMNAKDKKMVITCLVLLGFLVLLLIFSSVLSRKGKPDDSQARTFTEFPKIQEAEDKEALQSGNLNNYRGGNLATIFEDGSELSLMTASGDSAQSSASTPTQSSIEQAKSAINALNETLAAINGTEVTAERPVTERPALEPKSPARTESQPKNSADDRMREAIASQGYDPDEYFRTGNLVPMKSTHEQTPPKKSSGGNAASKSSSSSSSSPSSSSSSSVSGSSTKSSSDLSSGSSTEPAAPTEQESSAEAIKEVKMNVRRSDAISSLDDEFGGVQGLSSLDNENMFVDDNHPIKVMFVREEKIKSGQRVSLRLLEDMVVEGVLLPKNTHLTATCSIGDRLQLKVSNIEINGQIYTLNYTAYDTDGAEGIYCAQTQANKDAARGAEEAISETASLLGGAVGRLTSRAVQSGAQMIRSRTGETSVTVTSGYVFYLMYNAR